ncbi:MAG TPA: DUF6064 family protein [Ramlibacter sp.]|nr:DUF6064 family protein [Ramlibacter sp.]
MLPFTQAQFIEVFVRYNLNVWPVQVLAYLLGIALLLLILRPSTYTGRWVAAGLAAMWLWTGIAYHAFHFAEINKAAFLFAALFVVQALLLLRAGFAGKLQFGASRGPTAWMGWALILYASVFYPLLGVWAGHPYPEMPMFGITPCPLTLFTFGVFFLASAPVWGWLLVIPVVWSVIGGSAAVLLQVPQDWLLLFSGLSVIPLLNGSARGKLKAQPQ